MLPLLPHLTRWCVIKGFDEWFEEFIEDFGDAKNLTRNEYAN